MPVPKRWFPCSRDINGDADVWELTDRFGDHALRLWLELLACSDKSENRISLPATWLASLARVTRMNTKTVAHAVCWMFERRWLVLEGPSEIKERWLSGLRLLCQDWPKNQRRLAANLPQTQRRTVDEWTEDGRRLTLGTAKYWKYHKRREPKGALDGSPPNLPFPSLHKRKEEEEKNAFPDGLSGVSVSKLGMTRGMVLEAWNKISGVKLCRQPVGPTIGKTLEARIKEQPNPEWWNFFFRQIAESDFLCGRIETARGPFQAGLTWALKPSNRDKILAGDYDNKTATGNQQMTCTWKEGAKLCGQPIANGGRLCTKHAIDRSKVAELTGQA